MTRRDDAAAADLARHGGRDFRAGVARADCPLHAISREQWLAEWDAAAVQAAFVLRVVDDGLASHYDVIRDALMGAARHLNNLRSKRAVTAYGAMHREVEANVIRALAYMPAVPTAAATPPPETPASVSAAGAEASGGSPSGRDAHGARSGAAAAMVTGAAGGQ